MVVGKKGLGIGQVFIFIVAAITFALIMIFGYKAISGFLSSGEDVQFTQFKTDLENSVKGIYTEYGSVRIEKFNLPLKYEQICFVDMDADFDESLCDIDGAACGVWEDAQEVVPGKAGEEKTGYEIVDENVFLTPTAPVKIKVYKISTANEGKDYLCLPITKGTFSLVLEGRGDRTELSMPE